MSTEIRYYFISLKHTKQPYYFTSVKRTDTVEGKIFIDVRNIICGIGFYNTQTLHKR